MRTFKGTLWDVQACENILKPYQIRAKTTQLKISKIQHSDLRHNLERYSSEVSVLLFEKKRKVKTQPHQKQKTQHIHISISDAELICFRISSG